METDQIAIFQDEHGDIKIDAKLEADSLWLSLNQLVELFDRDKSVISRHLKKIFAEEELEIHSAVAKYATTRRELKTKIRAASSVKVKFDLHLKLQKLPRDSSATRLHITGEVSVRP